MIFVVSAAEDTRRTVALLSALEIYGKPILSCHEHNGKASVPQLLSKLRGGNAVALVTDAGTSESVGLTFLVHFTNHRMCHVRVAGTPVVSDPGQELVAAVVDAGTTRCARVDGLGATICYAGP